MVAFLFFLPCSRFAASDWSSPWWGCQAVLCNLPHRKNLCSKLLSLSRLSWSVADPDSNGSASFQETGSGFASNWNLDPHLVSQNFQDQWRLKMEPWRAVERSQWRRGGSKWSHGYRRWRLSVAGLHHFDKEQEQDPETQSYQSDKTYPDPRQMSGPNQNPQQSEKEGSAFKWCGSATLLSWVSWTKQSCDLRSA